MMKHNVPKAIALPVGALCFAACLAACLPACATDAPPRLWVIEKGWHADNGHQHSLLGGGTVHLEATGGLRLSATYLQGQYGSQGDIEKIEDWRFLFSRRLGPADVGAGVRYLASETRLRPGWQWDTDIPNERAQRNADIYGPFLSLGLQRSARLAPVAASLRASWMFVDLGAFDGLGYDGSHVTLEALVLFNISRLSISAGYRSEWFRNLPDRGMNNERFSREQWDGLVAGIGVGF